MLRKRKSVKHVALMELGVQFSRKLYRVIHKSVKHFKNSQKIDYSTDHGISYADRERNSPSF